MRGFVEFHTRTGAAGGHSLKLVILGAARLGQGFAVGLAYRMGD
jgi:hypothetical protein